MLSRGDKVLVLESGRFAIAWGEAAKMLGAHVEVLGKEVAVSGGSFSADVQLEPGVNLVDVSAGLEGRRPAFAVARVIREVRMPVPDLIGRDADTAQDQLQGLGSETGTG